ncbi:hypothetical protein Tco_0570159 [Tanacetum coccineum]
MLLVHTVNHRTAKLVSFLNRRLLGIKYSLLHKGHLLIVTRLALLRMAALSLQTIGMSTARCQECLFYMYHNPDCLPNGSSALVLGDSTNNPLTSYLLQTSLYNGLKAKPLGHGFRDLAHMRSSMRWDSKLSAAGDPRV